MRFVELSLNGNVELFHKKQIKTVIQLPLGMPLSLSKRDLEEIRLVLQEWQIVIRTQMHFNEIIMRARSIMMSATIAIWGAAAYSLQFTALILRVGEMSFHAAAPLILIGIGVLVGVFAVDYFYYYKMLIGAVKRSYEIDEAFREKKVAGVRIFGMSTMIRDSIGKPGRSKFYVAMFYTVPLIVGIIFLLVVLLGYSPGGGN